MRLHPQTFPQNQIRKWKKTALPLPRQPPWQEESYRFPEGLQEALPWESWRLRLYISGELSESPPLPPDPLFLPEVRQHSGMLPSSPREASSWRGFFRNSSFWNSRLRQTSVCSSSRTERSQGLR